MPGSKELTEGDPAQHGPLPRPGPARCSAFPACCKVPGTLWEQHPVSNRTNKALTLPRVSPASLSKSRWQRAMLGFVIRGSAAVSPTHRSRQLHLCLVLALHREGCAGMQGTKLRLLEEDLHPIPATSLRTPESENGPGKSHPTRQTHSWQHGLTHTLPPSTTSN